MSDPVLSLEGVEKGYNLGKPSEIRVLRDLTLSVEPGEVGTGVSLTVQYRLEK